MTRNLLRTRRAQGDHGAVLVVVAITMTALVSMAAFAVNLGSISLKRRDLQADADAIALDLGRSLDGRATTAYAGAADWLAEIAASRDRNNFPASGTETDGIRDLLVEPGCFVQATYTVNTTCAVADAVKVTATDDASEFFRFTNGTTSRSAIGRAGDEPIAGFSIGSKLAELDLDSPSVLNPVLTELLGSPSAVNLTLVGYEGLASADVTLGDLATELGFGTVDELLAADVTIVELLDASATVLGIGNPATVILNNLALQTDATYEISLGDLISVADGGEESAANTAINIFDLVFGSAQLANQTSFISVPNLTLGIPGLATSVLTLTITEAPQIAIGPARFSGGMWVTRAETAQIETTLTTSIAIGSCTGLLPTCVQLNMPITVQAAEGLGELIDIECADPVETSLVTIQASTQAAEAFTNATITLKVAGITLLNNFALAEARLPIGGGSEPLVFDGPYDGSDVLSTSATGLGLGSLLLADLSLAGLGVPLGLLGGLTDAIVDVDALILDPLFGALGFGIAGADVRTLSIDCTSNGSPMLVG